MKIRDILNILESAAETSLNNVGEKRLQQAREMGFNTDVILYHGSRAEQFQQFDKEKLGSYTGSPSAMLGFFFGTSRFNSVSYAGGEWNGVFKHVPALKEIVKEIKRRLALENIPHTFSMGMTSASAIPGDARLDQATKDDHLIRSRIILDLKTKLKKAKKDAGDYIRDYETGKFEPLDDFSSPDWVKSQLGLMTKALAVAADVIANWHQPIEAKVMPGHVGQYFLKLQNPLTHDQQGGYREETFADLIHKARANGNDGVIILNTKDPHPTDVYMVFEPEQIRSVDAAFDPAAANSPNIMS